MSNELVRFLRAALVDPVPRDHRQSRRAFWWRRAVTVETLATGAVLLGASLRLDPGDSRFYLLTLVLAVVWGVGAVLSGPLHLGWAHTRSGRSHARPVVQPLALGLLAVSVFTVGGVVVAQVPLLADSVNAVLDHARVASLPVVAVITVLNGLAEEVFFRGALFAALGRRNPVLISTLVYAATTVATGNVMLVFAALFLGLLVGAQRRVTGGVLAPMITHVTWSLGMLLILPPLLEALT